MMVLDQLIIIALLTLLPAAVAGRTRTGAWVATGFYALQLYLLIQMAGVGSGYMVASSVMPIVVWQQTIELQMSAIGWFFAVITVGSALAASCFASGSWGEHYRQRGNSLGAFHTALALNVAAMLLLLSAADILMLFIGWELVSWAGFLLMFLGGRAAREAALHYLTYAIAGAMAIFVAVALIYSHVGQFGFEAVLSSVTRWSLAQQLVVIGLLGFGFLIKMGIMPFHLWQAAAYAEAPGPGAAFLGAISARMGLFALMVMVVQVVSLTPLIKTELVTGLFSLRDGLLWMAALTIILPTYTALKQNDARWLLAWHGIGQGGYMLLGILLADSMGSAGGILHIFNYATYQLLLFLAVTAVVFRAGTANLNQLGGLVTRMPLSFLAMLVGIIGLAGIPPMNGFVSKWLIYRSLITEGMPLLFVATVIGTLGTILSVYKLIHNTFLGQLRAEHHEIREVPISMWLPMMLLAAVVFITGFMPGLALEWVAGVQVAVGLKPITYTLGGVETINGSLNMIFVVSVLFFGFGVGALLFYSGNRSHRVNQLDNYAGGHFLTSETRYHYSADFYAGLMHLIGGWYRGSFLWFERGVVMTLSLFSNGAALFYRSIHPSLYLLATAVLVLYMVV